VQFFKLHFALWQIANLPYIPQQCNSSNCILADKFTSLTVILINREKGQWALVQLDGNRIKIRWLPKRAKNAGNRLLLKGIWSDFLKKSH